MGKHELLIFLVDLQVCHGNASKVDGKVNCNPSENYTYMSRYECSYRQFPFLFPRAL